MAEVFQVKVIKPQRLKVDVFRLAMLNALRAEGRDVKKEYEKTTATWKRKPKFETLIGLTGKDASVFVGTDNEIYGYLDKGTKIRWALMSGGWKSKTSPGRIGSGPGAGRVILVGKRAMMRRNIRPRPGIKARKFSPTIQKRRKPKFTRRMVKAMQGAGARAF